MLDPLLLRDDPIFHIVFMDAGAWGDQVTLHLAKEVWTAVARHKVIED